MKKLILSALLFVILSAALPIYASPPREHGIAEYTFHVHINRDGSADIEERIVNRFTGSFNGVFLNINRRGFGDVTNITVHEYLPATGEYIAFTEVRRASEGDSGVFIASRDGDYHNIQVFSPSRDEYRVFVYRYNLTRAAARYLDAGRFDRTLIGRGWDIPIESYEVIITFEGADTEPPHSTGNIIYTLYIAAEPHATTTVGTNDIRFHSYGNVLRAGQSLGVDARFPYQWLPDARVINRGIDDRPFPWVSVVLIGIAAMVVAVILIIYMMARPHKVDFNERYYEELPSDNGPALMAYLVRHKELKIKDVLATLLNLARSGILTIQEDNDAAYNYIFIRNFGFVRTLRPHEEFLMKWLFEGIGNSTAVSMQDIQDAGKSEYSAMLFHENFSEWTAIVKTEAEELTYFESYWRRTPHGELEHQKWLAFKRYLKNLTDVRQVGIDTHAFWNSFLPYALSLGSAKKLMKNLPHIPKPVDMQDWDASNMLWFGIVGPRMLSVCTGAFSTTYSHGQSHVSAKADYGSGGGFSASSGGGGSSGGAF